MAECSVDIAPAVVVMADAARTMIAMPQFAPGAEIVIHTSADDDDDRQMDPHIDGGPAVAQSDVNEACCGGSTRTVNHSNSTDGNGSEVVIGFGRKRRLPGRGLLRVLYERDRGCRHPACGRTRHLHAHHVKFWRDGGTTDPDNMVLLCSTHHRALHQGEFSIAAAGRQVFTFYRRDGQLLETAPAIRVQGTWWPNHEVAADALVPVHGGKLDLGYATEVLYAAWAWRARQNEPQQQPPKTLRGARKLLRAVRFGNLSPNLVEGHRVAQDLFSGPVP